MRQGFAGSENPGIAKTYARWRGSRKGARGRGSRRLPAYGKSRAIILAGSQSVQAPLPPCEEEKYEQASEMGRKRNKSIKIDVYYQ